MSIKKRTIPLFFQLFFAFILLNACYDYGKSHQPYSNAPRKNNLAPPPPKIVGKPESKSEYMQKTYTTIKNTLEEAEVQLVDDSIKVLFPNDIIYSSKDVLPSSDYDVPLDKFSTLLKKYFKTNILISGHSDNIGKENTNRELSRVRAFNIKNVLVGKGISDSRLTSLGLGSLSPIADNATKEGRNRNRRVEFVVLYREK